MDSLSAVAVKPADDPKTLLDRKSKVEAVRGFEEMYLNEMLKTMRKTVPKAEEDSNAKAMWQERFDAEIAHKIAESGGIGLAKMLEQGLASRGKSAVRP
jgi:peptidoglycan hydrolase FlgJ